jgi:Bifunctional DNA primase/polymerase, N-terminal/Primase C terminal 1 (PriCT-1)
MKNNELLNAALEYAANGWPVLPCWWIDDETGHCACSKGARCTSPGKHPIGKLTPNGAADASLDPEQLSSWWDQNPQANIGGLVGPRANKAVLDVESFEGHGVDGELCLRQLEEKYREMLAPTASYITGNNGRNSVFRCVADDLKPTDYNLSVGVELRFADNQYVILPPSKTNEVYKWSIGEWRAPLKVQPWIIEAAQDSKKARLTGKTGAQKRIGILPENAQPGARHKSVVSLLGTLRARGISKEAAIAAALAYNSKSCDPPKQESYLIDTVEDIYARYEPRSSAPENEREYRIDENGLNWWHYKSEYDKAAQKQIFTPVKTRLSNFVARITKEIIRDDGREHIRSYIIECELLPSGDPLPVKEVKAEEFPTISWAYSWGVGAIIEPKPIIRDNLRAAIQTRSASTYETCRISTHIGWQKVGNTWRYLHAGGAITADGLDASASVDLGESRLQYYNLPEPSTGDALREDILKVITLCNGNPATMAFPDLGLTFRPIFNEINHGECCDYILGDTGIFKTARAAVYQAFYGPEFTPETLPAGWEHR